MLPWVYPNGRSHCSDPKVIETEAPKNDMITVDLKTQDTQLDPKQNPMPKKVTETEAPKNDMITVELKTQGTQLNPKQKPMSKKTMTPRYKFKRIKKGGKVQKIQSTGVHKITDSQNTPITSPNISCDSTVLDTSIPKSDSSKNGFRGPRHKTKLQNKVIEDVQGECATNFL